MDKGCYRPYSSLTNGPPNCALIWLCYAYNNRLNMLGMEVDVQSQTGHHHDRLLVVKNGDCLLPQLHVSKSHARKVDGTQEKETSPLMTGTNLCKSWVA